MLGFLARRQKRHLILVGPEGVGKRTLVQSLAQQLAEKQDPLVRSVVQIQEKALLENAEVALKAGLRQAQSGVLLDAANRAVLRRPAARPLFAGGEPAAAKSAAGCGDRHCRDSHTRRLRPDRQPEPDPAAHQPAQYPRRRRARNDRHAQLSSR
jgi:energy-coupling factor transporter ATP-binding protein EcfA2